MHQLKILDFDASLLVYVTPLLRRKEVFCGHHLIICYILSGLYMFKIINLQVVNNEWVTGNNVRSTLINCLFNSKYFQILLNLIEKSISQTKETFYQSVVFLLILVVVQ